MTVDRGSWTYAIFGRRGRRVLSGAVVFALFSVTSCAWKYVYQVPNNQSEVHYCRTKDGWDLAISRYKPAVSNPDYYPVVLAHGMGHNNYIWDLDKTHSFATYLRDRGYDVWSVSLRGAGKSTKPAIGSLAKVTVIDRPLEERIDPSKIDWNIDDHIYKDIPAILDHIKDKTGKDKVNWIGHSMGAMIICAYLERYGKEDINAVVSMAAPFVFTVPLNKILKEVEKNKEIVPATLIVNTRLGSQVGAPLGGGIQTLSDVLSYNRENTDAGTISLFLANVVEDVYAGVLKQYLLIIDKKEFTSADRSYSYTDNLNKIDVPILFVGGKVDNLCPPWTILYMYNNVSSADKTVRIFGKEDFCAADYGHVDLIIGARVQDEVYPYIAGWLDKRTVTAPPRQPPVLRSKEIGAFFVRR